MKLYKRDYTKLTAKELRELETENRRMAKYMKDGLSVKSVSRAKFSKAVGHYKSIFPNNHLDANELKCQKLEKILSKFIKLLNNKNTTERHILDFIKENEAYFITASILNHYSFGHHDAYLFQEFEMPPSYKSDYLIVGKSSMGYEFIFVEFENPYNNVTNKDGSFGKTIRSGYNQIEDWDKWLQANFSTLKLVFDKAKGRERELPREFIDFDKTRIHYVIVAGRRDDFNEKTYRYKRKGRINNILVLHYDNLIDTSKSLVGAITY